MESVSFSNERFNDQFAVIGRLYQVRKTLESLEKFSTEAVDLFSTLEGQEHTGFMWNVSAALSDCTTIKEAVGDIESLLSAMRAETSDIFNENAEKAK